MSPVIVGCGYVGSEVARLLQAEGHDVSAVARTSASLEVLAGLGISTFQADLDAPAGGESPALRLAGRQVFYFVPPPGEGREDWRLRAWLRFRETDRPRRVVYISTTGVYGDCSGDWVAEDRPVKPRADRAWRRWDAEQALSSWSEASGVEVVILRVAGIYGPRRLPLARIRSGEPIVRRDEAPYTNRIHVDDLSALSVAAMRHGLSGRVYHACDGRPGNMTDYFHRVADAAGLPRLPEIPLAEAEGRLSLGLLSYLRESRRLSNRRAREELGVTFRFPNLDAGLADCLPRSGGRDAISRSASR